MRHIFFSVFLIALSPNLVANNYLDISGSATQFNYQEHPSSSAKNNKETGFIPGISTSYGYKFHNIEFNLSAGYYNGKVDYKGSTQIGLPLTTKTEEQFTDIEATLIWYPDSPIIGVYTQIKWLEWQRNILATNKTIALHETYQWESLEAGFISPIFSHGNHQLELKFGLNHSRNGQLEVNLLSSGFGKPIIDLGDGPGLSTSLSYHFKLSDTNSLSIGLEHKQWSFSQGKSKSISNNTAIISIREPKSDSKRTSISLSYRFSLDDIF